jgi:coenzyme PQQ precursor peptide PqqA
LIGSKERIASRQRTAARKERTMKWTTPRIVEIAVGLEINSYACAELN